MGNSKNVLKGLIADLELKVGEFTGDYFGDHGRTPESRFANSPEGREKMRQYGALQFAREDLQSGDDERIKRAIARCRDAGADYAG